MTCRSKPSELEAYSPMQFEINHITKFCYTAQVFLEPHTLRLRPRSDAWQRLHSFDLQVDPPPAGLTDSIDLDGNSISRMWFDGTQNTLSITATSRVEALRSNPFDFILDPGLLTLPLAYDEDIIESVRPYLHRSRDPLEDEVFYLSHSLADKVQQKTLPFLDLLTRRIHESIQYVQRPDGDPWKPATTLSKGQGACRDLAVLQIDALRAIGLPARFVSGYRGGDHEAADRELHAWVEVYLPGAGWRGYDPTTGLAVADDHVALAAGPNPRNAAPTAGSFRGTAVTSSIWNAILNLANEKLSLPSMANDVIAPYSPFRR